MICGLDVKVYESDRFIFLQSMYGTWKIDKESLQKEEIDEKEFEKETNVKEVNATTLEEWSVYPRTTICMIKVSNIFMVTEYSGSEGTFHIMKVARTEQEALDFAEEEIKEYKYPFFWI